MKFIILILYIFFFHQTVGGIYFPFGRNFEERPVSSTPTVVGEPDETLFSGNENSEIHNSSVYRTEGKVDQSQLLIKGNSSLTNESSPILLTADESSTYSTSRAQNTTITTNLENFTAIFKNESHSQNSSQFSSIELPAIINEETNSSKIYSTSTSSNKEMNETSSTNDDEPEGVARGKPTSTESTSTTTSQPQTFYEKTWIMISDTYTLSILVPVTAGVVFATTILLTIACCRCLRRRIIRRRLRKKILPDSVKNLRPSDRARLLAESSDEEF